MNIEIKAATIDDPQIIQELNRAIFVNNPTFDDDLIEDFIDTEEGMNYINNSLNNKESICFILYVDGAPVGYANASPKIIPYRKSNYLELENIGVKPEHKGKGLGKLLLSKIEEEAKQRGFEKIYIECYARNTSAIDFYHSAGYKDIDLCLERTL